MAQNHGRPPRDGDRAGEAPLSRAQAQRGAQWQKSRLAYQRREARGPDRALPAGGYHVAVVGGGASGMAAALAAVEALAAAGVQPRVAVLERQNRVGRKLLATGNGRCNLSNASAGDLSHYHGGVALAGPILARWTPQAIRRFFSQLGLETVADQEGRIYPATDQAASVVDALRLTLQERGVQVLTSFQVQALRPPASGRPFFALEGLDGRQVLAGRVVLCCGGPAGEKVGGTALGHALLAGLGHAITPMRPALCQLRVPPQAVKGLKGLKYRGDIQLLEAGQPVQRERGEVLFTDYGVSGIAAMALCRRAAQGLDQGKALAVRLALCPAVWASPQALARRQAALPRRALEDFLTGLLPRLLGRHMLKLAGISDLSAPAEALSAQDLERLSGLLLGWTLPLTGTQPLAAAQVTAGGADTAQFRPHTLESRLCPGLFAAGELLDLDGDCGGFNLHWAWASGLMAGHTAGAGK